ncbi:hypothetical protein MMC18_005290 [Xylographa bjoerkii]|nr:hypothetical protein [Xylographa bjoerkii]
MLQYVALPKLFMERRIPPASDRRVKSQSDRRGLTDLQTIFDWLYRNRVRKIRKVIVVDDGDIPHSDQAVEEALKQFEVDVWDWKKLDICSKTIFAAVRNAIEISLYSTGNNAVLMRWCSQNGLMKFPMGFERRERMDKYIDTFRRALEADRGNNPRIEVDVVFINNVCEPKQEFVKIAVIDDGIDASLENIDGKIACGVTYCPDAASTGLMNAYYVLSGTHGTTMACLICKICPKSRLYVARLEEYESAAGKRQITAKSAADAILWAVKCGVDVYLGAGPLRALRLSTPELGSITSNLCYPGQWGKCIRVGAATATGEKRTWVHGQDIDFLLPGKDILVDGTPPSYQSGSSLATAIASGLGALLLYCSRLVSQKGDTDLRNFSKMKGAFKVMSGGHNNQHPLVRNYFSPEFKASRWNMNSKRELSKVMKGVLVTTKGLG